jgi:predicted permease
MGMLSQDVRFALRQLRKSPAFALTAIVTLGLGIGVNAAMFSVIEQVILRPLPYGNQSRMVAIETAGSKGTVTFSLPDLLDYQARSHALDRLAWYIMQLPTLGGTDDPQLTAQLVVSPDFFDVLGVHPRMGRAFTRADAAPEHNHVLILSDEVWRKFYNADPSIVGRTVPINGDPYTVVGVMPPGISFPVYTGQEIFSPLNQDDKNIQDRDGRALVPIGLLRPGVTAAQAGTELESIHRQLLHDYPKVEESTPIRVVSYHDSVTVGARAALFALDWAVLAVWLIACANVAGLMLTRTNARRREIAIRGALGAPRSRIMLQFLIESLLLALAGAAAGLGIAYAALRMLEHYLSHTVLYGNDIHINAGVFAFLLVASCISALLFGFAPSWHASGVPAQEGLREGTAAAGTSRRQALWRDGLVVGEITLTLALLIAAGLMMHTLLALRHTEMGFSSQNVVTASMFIPTKGPWWAKADNPATAINSIQTFYNPLLEKLSSTPGVESAGFTTVRPLENNVSFVDSVKVRNHPQPDKAHQVNAQTRAATTGYFQTLGIRLLAGRFFSDVDTPTTPVALIVNEAFVRQVFAQENPLGGQIEIGDEGQPREWGTVVGVVEDSHQHSASEAPQPEMNIDLEQLTPADDFYPILAKFTINVVVRSRLAPSVMEDAIRRNVQALQPDIAIQDLEPMQQVVDDALGDQTLAARLLGIFGFAALLIAVAGIYGLLAYSVSQRTRELGIRLALGAQRGDVLWLILRHAVILLAVGVAVGLVVAWSAAGIMRSFVYGAAAADAATILLVVLALGICALAASYLPARRAAAIDPIEALRTE